MTFSLIQQNTMLRVSIALVSMIALIASVLSPVAAQVAYADYGYDSYDYYYDDYYYYDDSYGYDSYDYYYDDYYYAYDDSYYYDDDYYVYDDSNYYNTSYDYDWGFEYGYDYGYYDYYDPYDYYDWGYDDYYYYDYYDHYDPWCDYDPCGCGGGCGDDADRPDVETLSATDIDEDSARLRCDVDPNDADTDVWFEYGETSSMNEDTSKRDIGDSGEERVERIISGLDEDEKYYFRCVAENDEGRTYGDTRTFTTDDNGGSGDDRPDVDTLSAKHVDEDSATLRCDVEINDDEAEVWFEYGETSSMNEDTSKRTLDDDDDEYERTVTGLDEDEKYYFRCVAENDEGRTYGNTKTFVTDDDGGSDDRPDVETLSAKNVDEDSAELRCEVEINDDEAEIWFEYGEDSDMDDDTSKRTIDDDDDEYERTVTGLDEDEKYYFRCVAENDEGRTYGDTRTFTTDDDDDDGDRPDVETLSATDIDEDSARLRCEVEPNGSDTDVWFEYGETTSMNDDTYKQYVDGDDRSERVDKIISGLDSHTIYYYRCVADNDEGKKYGSMKSFNTDDGGYTDGRAPDAVTNAAFNVGRTSARFVGTANIPSSARTIAWFEWGTSSSLGRTSASQSIGNGPSALVEHSQFSLAYNTTYYYRLVVQNTYGIDRGNIVSFTTLSAPPGPPSEPTPEPKEYDVRVMKSVENLVVENGSDTDILAERGQAVRYTIEVQNTGDYTLSETEITDLVPYYLEFANAEEQLAYDDPQREVVWYVGDLRPGETEVVTLDMVVTDDARTGMSIENIARIESEEYAESSNSVYIRVTDDIRSDSRYDRAAAGLFLGGGGFFPTTLVGWLFLAILILILVMLIRTVVGYYDDHKAKKAAEQAAKAAMAGQGGK